MTTWVDVSDVSNTFAGLSDAEQGYVVLSYVVNDYILGAEIWSDASDASTVWA